jgi:hypothetical protein
MISLKQFHFFFIGVSILVSGYYGIFEMINPSNPGIVSNMLVGVSFLVIVGLITYGFSIIKKFKNI